MSRQANVREHLGLTQAQEAFARYLAIGHGLSDAYHKSHNTKGLSPEIVNARASKLAKREAIVVRAQAILKELRVSDLDSAALAYRDLLNDINAARGKENWTAVAALTRLRLQVLGMLQEIVHLHAEGGMTDEQIVERLAGKDRNKAVLLKSVLGGEKYETNQKVA